MTGKPFHIRVTEGETQVPMLHYRPKQNKTKN